MSTSQPADRDRAETFLAFADFLIPAYQTMPAFSSVCGWEEALRALDFRPDLKEAFHRGLGADEAGAGADAEAKLEALHAEDGEAFDAVTTVVIATYYMNPKVREQIGYPGQENVSYEPHATQSYLTDGSLGKVIARGRKYRPTAGLA